MEAYSNSSETKLFSEILISDVGLEHERKTGPVLKIKGSEKSTILSEQQFRILTLLRKQQGAPVSTDDLDAFLYGDDEREAPLTNAMEVRIFRLNEKLRKIQDPLRFVILSIRNGGGYYLADLQHPETLQHGGEELLKQLVTGSRRGRKWHEGFRQSS